MWKTLAKPIVTMVQNHKGGKYVILKDYVFLPINFGCQYFE